MGRELKAAIESGCLAARCTCGFFLIGEDQEFIERMYQRHNCKYESSPSPPWYSYLFSIPGVLIIMMIVIGAMGVVILLQTPPGK